MSFTKQGTLGANEGESRGARPARPIARPAGPTPLWMICGVLLPAFGWASIAGADLPGVDDSIAHAPKGEIYTSAADPMRPPILLAQLDAAAKPDAVAPDAEDSLIASLIDMPLPSYVSPMQPASPGWSRGFGAVRSGKLGTRIEAVAPGDHAGLSFTSTPRLWWRLDGKTDHAIQVTIVDDGSIDPLFRTTLQGPHPAGLNALDLAQQGFELKPGVDYRWFVTLLVDPERPSRNPLSEGAIRVLPETDSRRAAVAEAPLPARGHRLAELGVWYDAYEFFSSLAVEHPEVSALGRHRDRLTETVLSE